MFRKFTAVIAGVFGTGLLFFFMSATKDTKATIAQVSGYVERAEGDLPGFLRGASCSASAWPNYDARCLFDMRPEREVRKIRFVDLTMRDVQYR